MNFIFIHKLDDSQYYLFSPNFELFGYLTSFKSFQHSILNYWFSFLYNSPCIDVAYSLNPIAILLMMPQHISNFAGQCLWIWSYLLEQPLMSPCYLYRHYYLPRAMETMPHIAERESRFTAPLLHPRFLFCYRKIKL